MTALERQSLATALGVWLAVLLALVLQLEDPWWAAISAFIITSPHTGAVVKKGILRIVGTLVGCILGYELALAAEGAQSFQMLVIFFAIAFAIHARYTRVYSYAWMMVGLVIAMMMAMSIENPAAVGAFAYYRSYEIVTGVVVASVVAVAARMLEGTKDEAPPDPPPMPDGPGVFIAALHAGAIGLVIVAVWFYFQIPSLTQVLVSVVAVMAPDLVETRTRARYRLAGCLAGGAAGLFVAALSLQSFWLWSVFFLLGMFAAARVHLGGAPHAYVGTQAGLAFIMAMVTGAGPPETILPAVQRVAGVSLAVSLVVVSSALVAPWLTGRAAAGRSA